MSVYHKWCITVYLPSHLEGAKSGPPTDSKRAEAQSLGWNRPSSNFLTWSNWLNGYWFICHGDQVHQQDKKQSHSEKIALGYQSQIKIKEKAHQHPCKHAQSLAESCISPDSSTPRVQRSRPKGKAWLRLWSCFSALSPAFGLQAFELVPPAPCWTPKNATIVCRLWKLNVLTRRLLRLLSFAL